MGFMKFRLEEKALRSNTGGVITELGIGNFKAFGETQRVPIKPLTLIFGANSSGKSSIIHALLLAHHAMETGEYDVRQTKLAGDMVDLGGFRNYVHGHDLSRPVTLRLETDIDRQAKRQALAERLDGKIEEILPFVKLPEFGRLSRFGDSLTLAGPEPTLAGIEVTLNGQPVLAFSRIASGRFQARTAAGSERYFSVLGSWMMEVRRAYKAIHELWADQYDVGISQEERRDRENKAKEILGAIWPRVASGEASGQGGLDEFNRAFAKVIAEDEFSFEGFVLRDPGQKGLRDWPLGREQMVEGMFGGLMGLFEEIESFGSTPDTPPRWVEAQAARHNLSALVNLCTARIADVLGRLSYLGPLRCVPSRYARLEGAMDASALARGGGAWDEIRRNPRVLGTVSGWLGEGRLRLPYILKSVAFLDASKLRMALEERESGAKSLVQQLAESPDASALIFEDVLAGAEVTQCDIGFGVSQVLPVLVNAAAMRERLIAIEQPELHLHPAQQAELGDVFIESALGERRNTFVLETHSEHLILRVLRRVRETTEGNLPAGAAPVRPEDVSVVFVEPTCQGSFVRQLPVTPDGDFGAPWPGGFFAERFQDLP